MKHELVCIRCPLGCNLRVEVDDISGEVTEVTGNTCKLGEEYGRNEVTAPMRTVTSTVRLVGGEQPLVPVKTENDVPKGRIGEVMEAIKKASKTAPVKIGDVIIKDVAGTGVNIVATRDID